MAQNGRPEVRGRNREDQTLLDIRPFLTSIDSCRMWQQVLINQQKIEEGSELDIILEQGIAWDYILQNVATNPELSDMTAKLLGSCQVKMKDMKIFMKIDLGVFSYRSYKNNKLVIPKINQLSF